MALYRKLPVTIEAEQFNGFDKPVIVDGVLSKSGISRYSMETTHCSICEKAFSKHGSVKTLEGNHIVCPGDMVIKGVADEYYPCKPDIFEATYEEV